MTATLFNQLTLHDFERARRKTFWRDLFSLLTRKCNDLLAFGQILQNLPVEGQYYRDLQTVSLDKIVGSEGRSQDFDREFFPRQSHVRDRWASINRAYYEQTRLPPVKLTKVGEVYFVRDGNHRISVARVRRQDYIDAYVTELDLAVPVDLSKECGSNFS